MLRAGARHLSALRATISFTKPLRMRRASLPLLLVPIALLTHACGVTTAEPSASIPATACLFTPAVTAVDLRTFDIEQHTCALEVVMRPIALRIPDGIRRMAPEKADAAPDDQATHERTCT